MTNDNENSQKPKSGAQPIFTLPGIVTGLAGIILAIHIAAVFVLDTGGKPQFTLWFAFIPVRYYALFADSQEWLPLLWTPITYAFIHEGWEHLLINVAWLAIFGTPVARRYGPTVFLVIFGLSAMAGAFFFAVTTLPEMQILVGASGGISGLTGTAMRFVFQPVEVARNPETNELVMLGRRLASFGELMRNVRTRTFILVWVALNGMAPLLPMLIGQNALPIAWQAHLGGFFVGLLIAPLFERKGVVQERE